MQRNIARERMVTWPHLAQYDPLSVRGNQTLTWTYTKEQISESFQVFYSYQAPSEDLSLSNTSTTGFRLSWRIENMYPPMKFTTSDVERNVHATFFKGKSFAADFYESDRVFTTTLLLPSDEKASSGSLVIHIEVETDDKEEDVKKVKTKIC